MPSSLLVRAAASVDAPPRLLGVLPELFEGCGSLGSSPRQVVAILKRAGVSKGDLVLDLACGKGAAAVAISQAFGCRVRGVDAMPPFVAAADRAAGAAGVSGRCTFRVGDVERVRLRPYADVAIMLGLFGADRAPAVLRRSVRSGGLYLLDDAFRAGPVSVDGVGESYASVPTLREARAFLTATGDTIVREVVPTRRSIAALNKSLYRVISRNARRLIARHPAMTDVLRAFLARQRAANRILLGPVRPALWLVRKS
ncbi:MAG: class I SAM-dependent methyltransferase [Phycisphaeraceae bacterium]|nr:class I SAM-dependent methyltransferase [Phycisphaeraceae bacterium]